MKLEDIGRLPTPGDNVAIASADLEAGTSFTLNGSEFFLSHNILEGHRFAVAAIARGESLYSWDLPFGRALRDLKPGDYVCNAGMLDALKLRTLKFKLPEVANFQDVQSSFELDQADFKPGRQVDRYLGQATFDGYARPGGRGTGTRNNIVILGTTSRTASFARALELRIKNETANYPNIDNIVAVTHTEGGGSSVPNNLDLVLRTLAGFMVHPNVGAVIAIDYGSEVITNAMLQLFMTEHGYPVGQVLHRFYSISREINAALDECERSVREWLGPVNSFNRSPQPLSELKIALQCGGSDAFSGVSGNPLAGCVAREAIRHGGSAVLAETDELIGAEPYLLANTRDYETALQFLDKIAKFKEHVAWHGHSVEGNTTGGNKMRGLYNNALKSLGAARKKNPDVCLDYVIDYAQQMTEPGFYFMDSPGNDLESIAGQVASGCNMIFFITGNGSITNFPFVPTIKFITTSGRWDLLSSDMDVNAGRYQDGMAMEKLSAETFRFTVAVAAGKRSAGELANHSQVSIWRDWSQTDGTQLATLQSRAGASGKPVRIRQTPPLAARFRAFQTTRGISTEQIGLIMPTSLCAGQIAAQITERLNQHLLPRLENISRIVSLPHTEGCGNSSGENEELYARTLVGHLVHPFVEQALLLEHGCEHTHNGYMRHVLSAYDVDPDRFGYASIQLDGGIENVGKKVEQWFFDRLHSQPPPQRIQAGLDSMSLALLATGHVSLSTGKTLAGITASIVNSGGTVVIPANSAILESTEFMARLGIGDGPGPGLDYGQVVKAPGLYIMSAPTTNVVETLTGLGGTGVQLMLAHVDGPPLQAHPMIPLVQVTSGISSTQFHENLDYIIDTKNHSAAEICSELLNLLCRTASRRYVPDLWRSGYTNFQVTRGLLGISL